MKNLEKENEKLRKENEESRKEKKELRKKKSLIDKISKRLLELKFEKHNSIKSKCLEWIVKKNTTQLQRIKNTTTAKNNSTFYRYMLKK